MTMVALALLSACCVRAQEQASAQEGTAAGIASEVAPPWVIAPPSVTFHFERPGFPVARFTLALRDNGDGRYRGEEALPGQTSERIPGARPFDARFSISKATSAKVFVLSERLKRFHVVCASNARNIADTGQKTLEYGAVDGDGGSCRYNYSENKDVQALTEIFQGIASTLDQGRRLDFLHRYDRLGLDDAIKALADEVSAGRALELGIIAPSLRSIADDADVMRRVRLQASTLLAQFPAETLAGAGSRQP